MLRGHERVAPRLVLLPGMDGTGLFFEPFLRVWSNNSETQAVAYPEREPLGYRELESMVRSSLPERPYVLLAESFSGPLAVMLAATRPQHLKGIILYATFVRNPYPALSGLKSVPFLPAGVNVAVGTGQAIAMGRAWGTGADGNA